MPVLLLTGAFEPFDQERAARAGYDGSLAKPFEPETLIAKVQDLLARAPQRSAAPPAAPVVPFVRPAAPVARAFVRGAAAATTARAPGARGEPLVHLGRAIRHERWRGRLGVGAARRLRRARRPSVSRP